MTDDKEERMLRLPSNVTNDVLRAVQQCLEETIVNMDTSTPEGDWKCHLLEEMNDFLCDELEREEE